MPILTTQEEADIRALDDKSLAKKNNKLFNGAAIGGSDEFNRLEEEYSVVRNELTTRGILAGGDERRLIDGSELA